MERDDMGAIFGVMGNSDTSDVEKLSERLEHRGDTCKIWSVSDKVRWGVRFFNKPNQEYGLPSEPVLFDGFLDNRADLAHMVMGDKKPSISDADLIFRLYEKYGPEGLQYISGQFSVAIWDDKRSTLILSCDSWTSRPIYYTYNDGRYIFASEYKSLLAIDSVPALIDREAIQYIQCTKYVMPERCCIADVDVLTGGTWVELSDRDKKKFRYQNINLRIGKESDGELAESIRNCFIRSVRNQAEPFPEIGVSLSSGLDSTLLIAAVRKNFPERPLHAFTAGFSQDDAVFEDAGRVASIFNAQHHKIILSPGDLPELIPKALWHMEDPVGREEKLYYFAIAQAAAKYVPLLLAGHNADALFGGMPRHVVVNLVNRVPFLKTPLEEFYHFTQLGQPPKTLFGKALTTAYFRGTQTLPPAVIGAGEMPSGGSIVRNARHPLSEFLREVQLYASNANLTIEKIHAAHQVVFNSPFLDTDMVRTSFKIPDRLKIFGMKQKYILRRAFRGDMSAEMVGRKKGLLRLKHGKEFCDVIQGMTRKYLSAADVRKRNLFTPEYVVNICRRPKNGLYSTEQIYRIWSILLVEIWARIFIDARGGSGYQAQ